MVCLIERIRPGYVSQVSSKQSKQIAEDLEELFSSVADFSHQLRFRIGHLVAAFKDLVTKRNHLLHATPIVSRLGEQRLRYSSGQADCEWTEKNIISLAEQFESAAIEANDCFTT